MGGWIAIIGDVDDFQTRLNKFKKIFSVEGVPELRIETFEDTPRIKIITWAWNEHFVPDVYVKKRDNHVLVLCGVVTDLGKYGPVLEDQNQTAMRILELWIEDGEKIIDQLNGSFSCLFYDQKEKKISLFTDRFASRSIWVAKEDSNWIVGNFPSAIATTRRESPKIDPVGLWSLLYAGRHLGTHGLYSGINTLMAGQTAVIGDSQYKISQWWNRKYQPENGISPKEWGYRLAHALTESADQYKRVCKRPYLFLSGGLDSRVAAAAFKNPLRTVTLCTSPNMESRIASLVSRSLRLEHQTIVRSPYWYLDTMSASALISSGNYLNHHTHFIVPIKDINSENPDAEFLLGDILENFNKHYFSMSDNNKLSFNPDKVHEILNYVPSTIKDTNRIGIHFNRDIRRKLEEQYNVALKEYAQSLIDVSEDDADRFDTFLRWADVSVTYTYNMITCMWPLAKERNLCFDNDLNKLSLKIPSDLRGAGILHKWILYHLDKKLLLIPDANNFLPPFFPETVKQLSKKIRPKLGNFRRSLIKIQTQNKKPVTATSGSWLLLHEMYRKDQRYRERIESIIFDKTMFSPENFDLEQIRNTWKEYLNGNLSLNFEIESLLSFGNLNTMIPCDGIN